jgi:hypothetical protein
LTAQFDKLCYPAPSQVLAAEEADLDIHPIQPADWRCIARLSRKEHALTVRHEAFRLLNSGRPLFNSPHCL